MSVHAEQRRAVESLLCPPFAPRQPDRQTPTPFAKAVDSYQLSPSTPKLFALLDALMLQGAHAWVCIAIHTVVHRRDVVPLSRVDLANLESMLADAELLMLQRGQQPPELSDGLEPGLRSGGPHRETGWQSQAMQLSARSPSRASTLSRSTGGLPSARLSRARWPAAPVTYPYPDPDPNPKSNPDPDPDLNPSPNPNPNLIRRELAAEGSAPQVLER